MTHLLLQSTVRNQLSSNPWFVRLDREGSKACVYAIEAEAEIDIATVVMQNRSAPHERQQKRRRSISCVEEAVRATTSASKPMRRRSSGRRVRRGSFNGTKTPASPSPAVEQELFLGETYRDRSISLSSVLSSASDCSSGTSSPVPDVALLPLPSSSTDPLLPGMDMCLDAFGGLNFSGLAEPTTTVPPFPATSMFPSSDFGDGDKDLLWGLDTNIDPLGLNTLSDDPWATLGFNMHA